MARRLYASLKPTKLLAGAENYTDARGTTQNNVAGDQVNVEGGQVVNVYELHNSNITINLPPHFVYQTTIGICTILVCR